MQLDKTIINNISDTFYDIGRGRNIQLNLIDEDDGEDETMEFDDQSQRIVVDDHDDEDDDAFEYIDDDALE